MTDGSASIDSILKRFEALNRIPRKSKNEERVSRWLADWAEGETFPHVFDTAGNLIVKVPGSPGRENEATVILQGHMDMVCEKSAASKHDFSTDPIEHRMDGEWLMANETTLGADNGIALAIAMEASVSLSHPPLELLFTVDEETGLTGARNLDGSALEGRLLINLDSEDEGVITIGCAGGRDAILTIPANKAATAGSDDTYVSPAKSDGQSIGRSDGTPDAAWMKIAVGGLEGGHSGVDIDKQLGNANRLLARVLDELLRDDDTGKTVLAFANLRGGSARNAIPRDSTVDVLVSANAQTNLTDVVERIEETLKKELAGVDDLLSITISAIDSEPSSSIAYSAEYLKRVVQVLLALPTGVQRMSADVDGLVESSCNLALCGHVESGIEITLSVRSSRDSRIDEMSRRIESIARLTGANFRSENAYPAWPPGSSSPLLKRAVSIYETKFGVSPVVEVIHAGLECAVIGSAIPGIEMISIGPTIKGAHSPKERLHVPTVSKLWMYLEALLESVVPRG